MKKIFSLVLLLSLLTFSVPAFAGTHGVNGQVSGKSILAGALSLLVWPGIGQVVNDQHYEKNIKREPFPSHCDLKRSKVRYLRCRAGDHKRSCTTHTHAAP